MSSLGIKARVGLFAHGGGIHITSSTRFTCDVKPTDLTMASIAAKLISFMYLGAGIGGDRSRNLCLKFVQILSTGFTS